MQSLTPGKSWSSAGYVGLGGSMMEPILAHLTG